MRKLIIGVMGPGNYASQDDIQQAEEIGKAIARQNWILLTGGRNAGVMDAASRGAKAEQGLTIGILPYADKKTVSPSVDIPIYTDLGNARNNINVLSSELIVVCGIGPGTASEIALAIKAQKHVILINPDADTLAFCKRIGKNYVHSVSNSTEAIDLIRKLGVG